MKINDLVSIRIRRSHDVAYGVLTEINLSRGTGVVVCDGKRYVRDLKRIKSAKAGNKAAARKLRKRIEQ